MSRRWPDRLWLVRHGQSAGNVARDAAHTARDEIITIAGRDMDVPLSSLGEAQARALGDWFGAMAAEQRPTIVLTSTYFRAEQTARLIAAQDGVAAGVRIVADERLREREFGVLDRLTRHGIEARFPEQAEARRRIGKFYHRPPGGESWCDVILRLRSVLDTISLHYAQPGTRLLVVAHQVVVLCLRYLVETLTEEEILAIDRLGDVANCGVTTYAYDPGAGDDGALRLTGYNFVTPLQREGVPITTRPDLPLAPA